MNGGEQAGDPSTAKPIVAKRLGTVRQLLTEARSFARSIGGRRTAVILTVSVISGLLVALIRRYLGSEGWKWAEELVDFVKVFASTIIIVGLLEWDRRRRWRTADQTDVRSLGLLADLTSSGWSDPKNVGSPDLDPSGIVERLLEDSQELAKASIDLNELYELLRGEIDELGLMIILAELDEKRWSLRTYYAEGSRGRRLGYLSELTESRLASLIERRDDPELFSRFVSLRDSALRAMAAKDHADSVIRECIFLDRPAILVTLLEENRGLTTVDPVLALAQAVRDGANAVKRDASPKVALEQLRFAIVRPIGAVRNELQWVEESLRVLASIVQSLESDIRAALDDSPQSDKT